MVTVREMTVELRGAALLCPVIHLVDKRASKPRAKDWLFTRAVETIVYGAGQVLLPRPHTHNPRS